MSGRRHHGDATRLDHLSLSTNLDREQRFVKGFCSPPTFCESVLFFASPLRRNHRHHKHCQQTALEACENLTLRSPQAGHGGVNINGVRPWPYIRKRRHHRPTHVPPKSVARVTRGEAITPSIESGADVV